MLIFILFYLKNIIRLALRSLNVKNGDEERQKNKQKKKKKFQAPIIWRSSANVSLINAPYDQPLFHPFGKGIGALLAEAYSEPCQTSTMELFCKNS